ncbi:hypothetical protein DB31_1709 [Hyalangium minutum]|uniref:Uncharacterized protein n=1 Tax=Hyalangium minutum TaxID=394096 RepID=A0A085WAH8_9BACT|nr:hypothetical protein DB31_1709 [Hyalangium minutum]
MGLPRGLRTGKNAMTAHAERESRFSVVCRSVLRVGTVAPI